MRRTSERTRKIIFESSVSLDGFIEGPNGELDWLISPGDTEHAVDFFSVFDTIFYGRKAYEKIGMPRVSWEELRPMDRAFFAALSGMRKYVFSRRFKHVEGNGMVIAEASLEEEVKRIREEQGRHIWFCGGADILQTFRALDLVDEYVISVHPVWLHAGKPLFIDSQQIKQLRLVEHRSIGGGVVVFNYRPQNRMNCLAPW